MTKKHVDTKTGKSQKKRFSALYSVFGFLMIVVAVAVTQSGQHGEITNWLQGVFLSPD
ncbi:MAG: hypothetical protein AAGD92_03930 [Pseudomonadota bacterium]